MERDTTTRDLEVRGGTPYDYKTRKRTFFFKPVK